MEGGRRWQKVENGGVAEPRRPDPVPEQEWKLKGLVSIPPTSSLSQCAHSLLDANTITLLGNARISGTVFSDDVSDPGTLPPKDSGFYSLLLLTENTPFIKAQISMESSEKLMIFFREVF